MKTLIILALIIANTAHANRISIYDSRDEKNKVYIEYCNKKCYYLKLDKKDLKDNKKLVDEWFELVLQTDESL